MNSLAIEQSEGTAVSRLPRRCLVAGVVAASGLCAWQLAGASTSEAFAGAWAASWIVPAALILHAGQSAMSAEAWRATMPASERLGFAATYRLRVLREGLDSLLPVAAVAGEIVAAGELRQRGGSHAAVTASLVVDVAAEIAGQVAYLAVSVGALLLLLHAAWWSLLLPAALGAIVAGAAWLIRARPLRVVSSLLTRLAPTGAMRIAGEIGSVDRAVGQLVSNRRAIGAAVGWHTGHWVLGAVETALFFAALGVHASALQILAVNGCGLAARSLGVVVPGSAGVQEGGFAAAGAIVGLPAEAALAVSLLRRFRELGFGLLAVPLLRWGRYEPALAGRAL